MSEEKLWDVVIYEKATKKIDAIIGANLRSWDGKGSDRSTMEGRVATGLSRINERYDCEAVEAGKYKEGDTLS